MTEPANLCWGVRNGHVSQSVSKELCGSDLTHTLGTMMSDLVSWSLSSGKLSIAFPSRWLIERIFEELHGQPSKLSYVLNSFTTAINRIEPAYDLDADEWTV